ncbi:MAG TPA: DNA polymerase IV [Candidatus Blautia stercorigallinarum]|uniref:DNA polymerase IV n=1 Tax=Candidatus Blautia stercorigallinarum TaxID=2838501 RepID=A0A9D1PFP0_9FIRM|nr:DNA polymerase IV [Candidatus Blautia stercorigallinarum]
MFENRVIFHVDVNAAYLSWEAVYRLRHLGAKEDLRKQAAGVGGDTALRHGIILAKSVPAKRYGIRTGESILEAKRKCPSLILVPPHYQLYEKASKAFIEILKEFSPAVEQYSIDEAFMDMTGTRALWYSPEAAAEAIRKRVRDELGFTVNIGISSNKVLAKMASDFEKPDKVHTLFPEEIETKLWPLSVSELFFVGSRTKRKLDSLGIYTIGELARTDPEILKSHLKKQGEILWAFANGIDTSPVEPEPAGNKGYGNSLTLPFDVTDIPHARLALLGLSETLGARMRKNQVRAQVFTLSVKTWDFRCYSHQKKFSDPTDLTEEIYKRAVLLLGQVWKGEPIRHLGIQGSGLAGKDMPVQGSLFQGEAYEKRRRAEMTVDRIRQRYGADAVKRAAFLDTPIDHMSGGISREKRTVLYKLAGERNEI